MFTHRLLTISLLLHLTSNLALGFSGLPRASDDNIHSRETSLREELMRTYNTDVRPVKKMGESVTVQFGLSAIDINFDEHKEELEVNSWVRLKWNDVHLSWNSTEYPEISVLLFSPSELWLPDISHYNSVGGVHIENEKIKCLVYPTGDVLWVPPITFNSHCKPDLTNWPLDEHSCIVKFGSWTQNGFMLNIQIYENKSTIDMSDYLGSDGFKVTSHNVTRNTKFYDCCPEPYTDITYTLGIKRSASALNYLIFIPALVVLLLPVAMFLLPPTAGEKLTLGITSIHIMIAYLIYFTVTLPLQATVPRIVLFFTSSLLMVVMSVLISAAVIYRSRLDRYEPAPCWLKNLAFGYLSTVCCIDHLKPLVSSHHTTLQAAAFELKDNTDAAEDNQSIIRTNAGTYNDWLIIAVVIDRVLLVIYSVLSVILLARYFC